MKPEIHATVAVVLTLVLLSAPSVHNQEQIDFGKHSLEDRRSILRSAAAKARDSRDPAIVTLMRLGLGDPDPRVRFYAGSMLTTLVTVGGSDRRSKRISLLDEHGEGLPAALVPLCGDPDFRMRGAAVQALAFIGPWTAALEALLINTYDRETESAVRTVIVHALTASARPSPDVERVLLHAIGDPDSLTRNSAALGFAKHRPLSGLSRLVDELRAGDARTREAVIHAITSYGVLAKPYLGDLEAWLWSAKAKARAGEIEQLRQAIASIRESR